MVNNAGITSDVTGTLQRGAELRVELTERSGDGMANCFGLPGETTASDRGIHVNFFSQLDELDGLHGHHSRGLTHKVIFVIFFVYCNFAGSVFDPCSCYSALSATSCVCSLFGFHIYLISPMVILVGVCAA